MRLAFHVQYGLSRHVGRFHTEGEGAGFAPGQNVVVKTSRGTEMGRVVAAASPEMADAGTAKILRKAEPADHDRARRAEGERHLRFDECRRVFDDGVWPIEPVDVEPLLDDDRAVLHYLGPHKLDVSGLSAALRSACGLDLVFEPVGRDIPEAEPEAENTDDHGCGNCGSDGAGGCGTGGGCGTASEGGSGGCSGCSVGALVSTRRRAAAPG